MSWTFGLGLNLGFGSGETPLQLGCCMCSDCNGPDSVSDCFWDDHKARARESGRTWGRGTAYLSQNESDREYFSAAFGDDVSAEEFDGNNGTAIMESASINTHGSKKKKNKKKRSTSTSTIDPENAGVDAMNELEEQLARKTKELQRLQKSFDVTKRNHLLLEKKLELTQQREQTLEEKLEKARIAAALQGASLSRSRSNSKNASTHSLSVPSNNSSSSNKINTLCALLSSIEQTDDFTAVRKKAIENIMMAITMEGSSANDWWHSSTRDLFLKTHNFHTPSVLHSPSQCNDGNADAMEISNTAAVTTTPTTTTTTPATTKATTAATPTPTTATSSSSLSSAALEAADFAQNVVSTVALCLSNQDATLNTGMIKGCRASLRSLRDAATTNITLEVLQGIEIRIKLLVLFIGRGQGGELEDCVIILRLIVLVECCDELQLRHCCHDVHTLLLDALNLLCCHRGRQSDPPTSQAKPDKLVDEVVVLLSHMTPHLRARCERLLPRHFGKVLKPQLLKWRRTPRMKIPCCEHTCTRNCCEKKLVVTTVGDEAVAVKKSKLKNKTIGVASQSSDAHQSFELLQPTWKEHQPQQSKVNQTQAGVLSWGWFNTSLLERRKDIYHDHIQTSRSERSLETPTTLKRKRNHEDSN
eukprot:m.223071 g.223071  ORF g.223071 m.223071 type:complete len:645 (-) comp33390_c0_seq2:205-2139(-)